MCPELRRNFQRSRYSARLKKLAGGLRRFKLTDQYGLSELLEGANLPTPQAIQERLSIASETLPDGMKASELAAVIHNDIIDPSPELSTWREEYSDLPARLASLSPGPEDATEYHRLIFKYLGGLFDYDLSDGKIEREIDSGRQRIDLLFRNSAGEGFWSEINSSPAGPAVYLPFECKNYKNDPATDEFGQLISRLSPVKKMTVGILICRDVGNKRRIIDRCHARLESNERIIYLTDSDLSDMHEFRAKDDLDGMDTVLHNRLEEVLLGAPKP